MLTAAACGTLSRTAVLNKSVATLRLAGSLASRGNLPAPAAGTCRLASVEPCRGPRRERTELAGYKLNQTAAALAACLPDSQGGQRRNAAHYHCIVHRKWAGFGPQLPRSWRTVDQSRVQSTYDTRNAQKHTRTGNTTPEIAKKRKGQRKTAKKR
jgi:hypothetical protein